MNPKEALRLKADIIEDEFTTDAYIIFGDMVSSNIFYKFQNHFKDYPFLNGKRFASDNKQKEHAQAAVDFCILHSRAVQLLLRTIENKLNAINPGTFFTLHLGEGVYEINKGILRVEATGAIKAHGQTTCFLLGFDIPLTEVCRPIFPITSIDLDDIIEHQMNTDLVLKMDGETNWKTVSYKELYKTLKDLVQ